MTDAAVPDKPVHREAALARLGRAPARWLFAPVEALASARGAGLAFFAVAAFLSVAPWVHPPLSPDVRGLAIPGLPLAESRAADGSLLDAPASRQPDAAGLAVLAAAALGALVVLVSPRWAGVAAGLLLAAALAANAGVALNHPLLVERMDFEHDMRAQMPSFLDEAEPNVLTNRGNGRVTGDPVPDGRRGDAVRGWNYLLYGWWLVPLGAAGVLFGARGRLPRRLGALAFWCVAGVALAVVACLPRLRAEYEWVRARLEESRGRYAEARARLDGATGAVPEFGSMERHWLLLGRLDFAEGRDTPQARYFRVHQLEPHERPKARDGARELMVSTAASADAVRREFARVYSEAGLGAFRQSGRAVPQDAWRRGKPYFESPGFYPARLVAAQDHWRTAADALHEKRNAPAIYAGEAAARLDPYRTEPARERLAEVLHRLPDRPLRADTQSTLGDASFRAGDYAAARRWYLDSVKSFMLPKIINYRAQKGLGGL